MVGNSLCSKSSETGSELNSNDSNMQRERHACKSSFLEHSWAKLMCPKDAKPNVQPLSGSRLVLGQRPRRLISKRQRHIFLKDVVLCCN